ncbi:hypothetical protein ACRAWD_02215 [Caulobacter segnis]
MRKILFTGVGGTGVTTVASILAMAAHIDGRGRQRGRHDAAWPRRGGSVFSHVKIGETEETIVGGRVPAASAGVLIACDLLVPPPRPRACRCTQRTVPAPSATATSRPPPTSSPAADIRLTAGPWPAG